MKAGKGMDPVREKFQQIVWRYAESDPNALAELVIKGDRPH